MPKSAPIRDYPRTSDWRTFPNSSAQTRSSGELTAAVVALHTREVAGSKPAAPIHSVIGCSEAFNCRISGSSRSLNL